MTARTVHELRRICFIHGLPEQLVSDNGPQFTADKFNILNQPHSNELPMGWQSTLFSQTFKEIYLCKLANILEVYRTTPHATTGKTRSVLLMGRNIRKRLDVLKPTIRVRLESQKQDQAMSSSHHPLSELYVVQSVSPEATVEETYGYQGSSPNKG